MLGYIGSIYSYLPSHVKNGIVVLLCIFESIKVDQFPRLGKRELICLLFFFVFFLNFISRAGHGFNCQEVIDLNMAGTYISAPARARTHDRRIRRPRL